MAGTIKRGTTIMTVEFLDSKLINKYGRYITLEKSQYSSDFIGYDLQGNPYCFMQSSIRSSPNIMVVECFKN